MAGACQPNPAHYALLALEQLMEERGKKLTILSQNVDRLHQAAGSRHVVELHGSIWDVCCAHPRTALKDGPCWEDRRQPLCPALAGCGNPCELSNVPDIPVQQLPRDGDGQLLRPGVVWFGEGLDPAVLASAHEAVADCQARRGDAPWCLLGRWAQALPDARHARCTSTQLRSPPTTCLWFCTLPPPDSSSSRRAPAQLCTQQQGLRNRLQRGGCRWPNLTLSQAAAAASALGHFGARRARHCQRRWAWSARWQRRWNGQGLLQRRQHRMEPKVSSVEVVRQHMSNVR